ncbi:MAG: hypothetical protein K2Y23_03990 [Cyanobacteria bacterium]|nr:hypothetical protein [Cyanobacteriota bacterium]
MFQWIATRRGLRWKFNLAVLPAVALILAVLGLMDAVHERQAVFAAHVMHASGTVSAVGAPVEPTPEAVARRSLLVHGVYALALLSFIAVALNVALSRFVLSPIGLIRQDIGQMERGHWRLPAHLAGPDEVGGVVESVHVLGLTIDALVAHMIRAERLATLASLAARTTAQIEPRVERIGAAVSRLYERPNNAGREAEEQIATASAEILAALRGLDRAFEASLSSSGRRTSGPSARW